MKLEIEKHLEALVLQGFHDLRANRSEQFLADLDAALSRVQPLGHGNGRSRIREIQGNNDRGRAGHLVFLYQLNCCGLIAASSRPFSGRMVDHPWQVGHCQCSCLPEKPQAWQRYLCLSTSSASTIPRRIIRLA